MPQSYSYAMKKEPISVDFRSETGLSQVLSSPAGFVSSREASWENLHFEYHHHSSHETPEHYPTQHVIAIQTSGEVQAERRLGGQMKAERIVPGDLQHNASSSHFYAQSLTMTIAAHLLRYYCDDVSLPTKSC